jgi:hypothetical protein
VRRILDAAGRRDVQIIASDDLDEHRIARCSPRARRYDAFGVGTAIALTPDAASLGAIYKLVEVEDRRDVRVPVGKRSPAKPSFGGRKQVYRVRHGPTGTLREDIVGRADDGAERPGEVGPSREPRRVCGTARGLFRPARRPPGPPTTRRNGRLGHRGSRSRGGTVLMWWAITTTASSSVNGALPVSMWKSSTPTA